MSGWLAMAVSPLSGFSKERLCCWEEATVLKADEEDKSLPAGCPSRRAALANVAMSSVALSAREQLKT